MRVSVIFPGAVDTRITENSGVDQPVAIKVVPRSAIKLVRRAMAKRLAPESV